VHADNPNRPNIAIEVGQHNPNNFDNKGKKHFYRLWRELDFEPDPWLDSLVEFHALQTSVHVIFCISPLITEK
jgi:hypothetical protein